MTMVIIFNLIGIAASSVATIAYTVVWWMDDLCRCWQWHQKLHQQSTVYDQSDPASQHPHPRDNNTSVAEHREHACRLAEYLQRKNTLQVPGVEIGLNSHPCSQKLVLLTRALKLIGSCLDDVINWAKAIPGLTDLQSFTHFFFVLWLVKNMLWPASTA